MSALPGVSIVIPNYNMGRFVAAAIDSALAQDHPCVEVIVVDDASSDQSREIIASYKGRVRTILLETNGGQMMALNTGWPLAQHPIVMFLDSDDMLMPHAASRVAAAFSPTAAKVQFCLKTMNAAGRALEHVAPKYPSRLETETIRGELLRTGSSPCAQGSGNAYAKWMLEKVKNVDGFNHPFERRLWMDAILEINAPFYGEVVTLSEPLCFYRIHDSNWSAHNCLSSARFSKMVDTFDCKLAYMAERCRIWGITFDPRAARERCLWAFEYRLAAAKLQDDIQNSAESPLDILSPALRASATSPYSWQQRLFRGTWIAAVCFSPRSVAEKLIKARFVVDHRPRWIECLFRTPQHAANQEAPELPCHQ